MEIEEIKNKVVRGIVALTGRSALLQVANFLTFIFLAAFLGAANIGVFIAVSAIRDIFNLFIDVGLGAALVQKKEEVTQEELSGTFIVQEILVVIALTLGFFFTGWIKTYLNLDPAGVILYWALLGALLINSLKVIPSIILERKLEFEKQVMPQLLEAVVFNTVVVILAWKNFGLYSYSWAIILGSIAGLGGYYLVSPWRPSWNFSKTHLWKLISFGLQFQGKSYLAMIKDQLLTLFLTRTVGFSGIGYWGFAQRWAYSPFRFIVDSVTKVSFPTYARLQHDSVLLKVSIEKSLFIVSLTLFPMLVLVAFLGQWFVEFVPRLNQYRPALISLYFLCFQAGISALSNILVNVLDANGRVKTTLGLMTMWIVSTWILTVVLVGKIGFNGIALAQLLVAFTIFITIYLVNGIVRFSFMRPIIKPLLAVILMIISGLIFTGILGAVSAIIVYCLIMGLIARKELMTNAKLLIAAYR